MVASRLGTALRRRMAILRTPSRTDEAAADPARSSSLGLRLTGDAQLLERPVVVRDDTVAVLVSEGEPPRIAHPGEHLKPRLLPALSPIRVMVVNTAPVSLDVTIAKLTTLDDFDIERTTIRLSVQLTADDGYARVQQLAAEFGPELEANLLRRVENEVVGGVQGAIRMNRLADVRRLTLPGLLANRWLPETFAGGALLRRDFTVLGVVWPPEPAGTATDSGPTRGRASASVADASQADQSRAVHVAADATG